MSAPHYYITTAISYPNGDPHIGHAYEMIATDILARFKRLNGFDVRFLTGTDEHGIKMVQTAQAQGLPVSELADRNAARFSALADALGLSHDDFIRTTEPRHHRATQEIWRRMQANGDIYEGVYSGWYSVRDEAYYDESELSEEGGQKLSPQGTPVEWVEEKSFFFKLSAYQDRLLALYESNPDFIAPRERRNEVMRFVSGGLQDLSISRTTFDWGVRVPGAEGHVMYVWVDALTNYLTGVGFPDEASELFTANWPADLHVIGKDIVRFHTVYWPAFLMSAGIEVPKRVFAHGFLTVDGRKMSKSLGNVVDPFPLIEEFGADPLRYFLAREVAFGADGDYSRPKLVNRSNADLANDFGNLAQRALSMIAKNCEGRVPAFGPLADADRDILALADAGLAAARRAMDQQKIHEAAAAIWDVASAANRYFAAQEPWALKKTDPERMASVLYVTAEVVRRIAIPALAFVPDSAGRILDYLGVVPADRVLARAGEDGALIPGDALPAPSPVFKRFEREKGAA